MIDIHDPLTQAILGLAMTFVLWGVDKITDKDNLEALSKIAPDWGSEFMENHPSLLDNVKTAVRILLYGAGIVYFIGGLILLHEIGLY